MNIHQGDVILEEIKRIPEGAKFLRKNVVVYGEVTGHAHEIDQADIYEKDGILYVKVIEENPMVHPDHPATKKVPIGARRVKIQKEYFPDGSRQVKD